MSPSLPVSTCNALIRRSIDLRQLYRHAATACEPGLRMVLNDNAHTLELLVADLQAPLSERGARPCRRGSWRGVVHRHLAGWLMRIAARRDHAWIHLLAHDESLLLRRFELVDFADQPLAVVPTGVARIVEIARALAAGARVLLLDEPSSGMSEQQVREFAGTVRKLRGDGLSVVLVEHDRELVGAVCDEVFELGGPQAALRAGGDGGGLSRAGGSRPGPSRSG